MENIRRMALRTVQRLEEVEAADRLGRSGCGPRATPGPAPLATALAAFVSGHPPLTPTFVARFLQQLRTYQTNFTPLVWLEQWIAEDSLSAEDAIAAIESAVGADAGHDGQQHHQPAHDRATRLVGVRGRRRAPSKRCSDGIRPATIDR